MHSCITLSLGSARIFQRHGSHSQFSRSVLKVSSFGLTLTRTPGGRWEGKRRQDQHLRGEAGKYSCCRRGRSPRKRNFELGMELGVYGCEKFLPALAQLFCLTLPACYLTRSACLICGPCISDTIVGAQRLPPFLRPSSPSLIAPCQSAEPPPPPLLAPHICPLRLAETWSLQLHT